MDHLPRITLARSQLETMLLEFLQAYPKCKEARGVSLRRLSPERENGANWTMETYNPGRALRVDCDVALRLMVPIMQHHFDVAPDA
jgi:hypothetical protein